MSNSHFEKVPLFIPLAHKEIEPLHLIRICHHQKKSNGRQAFRALQWLQCDCWVDKIFGVAVGNNLSPCMNTKQSRFLHWLEFEDISSLNLINRLQHNHAHYVPEGYFSCHESILLYCNPPGCSKGNISYSGPETPLYEDLMQNASPASVRLLLPWYKELWRIALHQWRY